jgi:hypothetical protein
MRRLLPLALIAACEPDVQIQDQVEVHEFVQEQLPGADVLVIVDDSRSMEEEQVQLAAGFSAFMDVLFDTSADYRLAVTSTSAHGELHGGVFHPYADDLYARALDALAVGTDGSRDEQGLEAALQALDPARNPDFHRGDSRLQIVVFSDEDDHSLGTVDAYLDALHELAGDGTVTVHGVVGDLPAGCASPNGAADAAPRYTEAIQATSGLRESICAASYVELLRRVGFEVSGLADTFALGVLPAPETLVVTLDGVTLHERDVDGWRYEPAINAIVLDGHAVPRPGMTLTVTYTRWSGGPRSELHPL